MISYDRLYSRLYDDKSRNILRLLIAFRLVPDNSFLQTICEKEKIKYFDSDIYSPNNSDVFIECSCHDNSVPQHIKDNCTKIYLYGSKFTEDSETNPDNIITIRFPDFETVNATAISYNDLFAVKIDKDITEKTKAIIIDNDLLNIPKLIGAKNHIKNDFPLIAIGINDSIESIYEIPEIIDNIHSNYKLYIRHYIGTESRDTVLYAIPPQKRPKESIKFKKVAAIAPYSTHGWSNAQLTKDCELIPFLLYKSYGMDVSFVGVTDRVEDYPSA